MLNFLVPQPSQPTTTRRRALGFFLLLIAMLGIGTAVFFGARQYAAARWISFAENIGKKIMAVNWWPASRQPAVAVIPQPPRPVRLAQATTPDPATFSSRHIMVRDHGTGEMLFGKAAYEPWPIASLTKLLSALVLLETPLNFNATTTAATDIVYDNDIVASQVYQVKDLWGASLVASSNRAVLSLIDAAGVPRADFVARLNQKATQIGLTNTAIFDPTGLDPKNISTAADMAILIAEAFKKPPIRDTVLLKEYAIATDDGRFAKNLKTTNWLVSGLISKAGLDIRGGKTGSIPEAEFNLAIEVATSSDRVIDIVVLGSTSHEARFVEARQLAQWVFRSYEWK